MHWTFLIVAILCNTVANLFIRKAALDAGETALPYFSLTFIVGVGLFGVNLLFYALSTRTLALSVAYPLLAASSLILVYVASLYFYAEKWSWMSLAGIGFLTVGIILVGAAQQN